MNNEVKPVQVDENTVILTVLLNQVNGKDAMKVQLVPQQNIKDLWQALAYLMEAVGVTAASMSQNGNPKGIEDYEGMASYVSEYITTVIMQAVPKERR